MAGRFRFVTKYPLGSAFVIGFLVILAILNWRRVTEPRYAGKGIREWIEQLPHDNGHGSESNEALDHFGQRAVPYLIDAMQSPSKMEKWLAGKTPGVFRGLAPDLWLKEATSRSAVWKLAEIVEREHNQANGNENPVLEAIWFGLLEVMRAQPERIPEFCYLLQRMGPLRPEAEAELRNWWSQHRTRTPPGGWEMREVALLLASTKNPTLVDDFLADLSQTNFTPLRAVAAEALGELGSREERVIEALRASLSPVPGIISGRVSLDVIFGSLRACALLGICPPETERWLGQAFPHRYDSQSSMRVLVWLSDTNNEGAATLLTAQLGRESPFYIRVDTAKLLGRAGRKAKQFVPALEKMREDSVPIMRETAERALAEIEPDREAKTITTATDH